SNFILLRSYLKSSGLKREQIKYLVFGTIVGFCGGATTYLSVYDVPVFPYGVYLVPVYIVTVSYAIFKHQLMDISLVIKKTLLYSLISAALACVYVGTITVFAQLLESRHGSASAFSSALAAIFITLLFNPVRLRTQRAVDRYFPREK